MPARSTNTIEPPSSKAGRALEMQGKVRSSAVTVDAFEDMQALLRFGHGGLRDSTFLLLGINDVAAAGHWLASVDISSARTITPPPAHALQLAFTIDGLRALQLPDKLLAQFSDEFVAGMANDDSRSRRLGDTGDSAPEHWQWGSPDGEVVHALLLLYARADALEAYRDSVLNTDFGNAFRIVQTLPTDTLQTNEPFGFTDGISQPAIDWDNTQRTDTHARDGYSNLLATGEVVLGYPNEYGELTHRPLLDPDAITAAHALIAANGSPGKLDFGAHGSYLVLRQLEQDVDGFRQFTTNQHEVGIPAACDTPTPLATAMVGRQRDGTPLVKPSTSPIPGILATDSDNHFTYDDDPDGLVCPHSAHVRRANPRSGDLPSGLGGRFARFMARLGFGRDHKHGLDERDMVASSRFHRLLRRGRAYGPPLESADSAPVDRTLTETASTGTRSAVAGSSDEGSAEVGSAGIRSPQETSADMSAAQLTTAVNGLQFICLVGNILRQFEFVQSAWMSGTAFAGTRPQSDPLLGTREARLDGTLTDLFRQPDARGAAGITRALPRFVRVRGGAYFFLPGIRAVRYIGAVAQSTRPSQGDRPS